MADPPHKVNPRRVKPVPDDPIEPDVNGSDLVVCSWFSVGFGGFVNASDGVVPVVGSWSDWSCWWVIDFEVDSIPIGVVNEKVVCVRWAIF